MTDRGDGGEKLEFAGRPWWKFLYEYHITFARRPKILGKRNL